MLFVILLSSPTLNTMGTSDSTQLGNSSYRYSTVQTQINTLPKLLLNGSKTEKKTETTTPETWFKLLVSSLLGREGGGFTALNSPVKERTCRGMLYSASFTVISCVSRPTVC